MAENRAEFVLSLAGDSTNVGALFAAFKRQVRSDVSEIEATTNKLDLFKGLQEKAKSAASAFFATKERVRELKVAIDAIESAGGTVGKELARALKEAENAAGRANKELDKQSAALKNLRVELTTAGVDTTKLAAAEEKLAVQTRAAAAAAVEQQSKTALSFRTMRDITPEANRLNAAFLSLRDSGKLTFGELSIAQGRLQQQLAALKREVGGVGAAFNEVRGSMIAFTALFAGIVAAGAKSAENFREFTTQIAAIGTIAGVSEGRLAELGDGVRRLARDMGVDAVDSAKALYNIIGSGIAPDNSLAVLALAAKAARAGLTDVHTAAAIGVAILNGYQLQVSELEHVYDVLFQTVKDGVVTFPELAKNLGAVIPIARLANVPLEELTASFVVLTRQGIDAPEAATAIGRAIQELSAPAPEAAQRMRDLNIQWTGFVGTVEQIAKLNLSADQIQKLIPETRAIRAVGALALNFQLLTEQVNLAFKTSASMQQAYERMAATPQAKVDRFNASIKDLSLSVGEFVTSASPFIERLTDMANAFNGMGSTAKQTTFEMVALAAAAAAGLAIFRVLAAPLNILAGALASFGASTVSAASGFTAVAVAVTALQAGIAFFLGFKVGEILHEWSEAARFFGTGIALIAASVTNLASFGFNALTAAVTFNGKALREATTQFRANLQVIAEQWADAITGGTEKTRKLTEEQQRLAQQLSNTSKAAAASALEVDGAVTKLLAKLGEQATAAAAAITKTEARLSTLVSSLQAGVQATAAAAQAAIANLASTTATQLASLSSIDVARIQETVAIQQTAATERIVILKKFAADVIVAFNAEADARKAIAIKSGEDLKRVDQEISQARRNVLQSVVDAYRAHVDSLLALERGHLDNIRAIEEQRRGINQSVEEKIREIRRQSLDAYFAYSDKVREIDEFISKGRQALVRGDTKLAEEFANKAIAAATSIAGEVKEGEEVIVSATRTQGNAISALTQAQGLMNAALETRVRAEERGAEATKKGLDEALPLLQQYEKQLKEVSAIAEKGIIVKIDADVTEVLKRVVELDALLQLQKITLSITADLKKANDAIKEARERLADGIPVPLIAMTDALYAALKRVRDEKPELNLLTDVAQGKVEKLRASAEALNNLEISLKATVLSNVDDVQKKVDKLKENTSSTHTVTIVTKNADGTPAPPAPERRAAGGLVGVAQRLATGGRVASGALSPLGAAVQRFARGGQVFNRPAWNKVPGTGSGDTVPAALQAGSYVVRKAASRYYGDGLMARLAGGIGAVQRLAGGGTVTKQEVQKWAKTQLGFDPFAPGPIKYVSVLGDAPNAPVNDPLIGFKTGNSFQGDIISAPFSIDTRPIPEVLITALNVLTYAREMLNMVGQNNPLLGTLRPAILASMKKVEQKPTDAEAVKQLLKEAETIGANPFLFSMLDKHMSAQAKLTPTWFFDWLQKRGLLTEEGVEGGKSVSIDIATIAQRFFRTGFAQMLKGNQSTNVSRRFQRGTPRFAQGGPTDTVPALLTPGEWIVRKSAVARYGTGLLEAINSMRLPRLDLANMLMPPQPPTRVHGFAEGGPVGGASGGRFQRGGPGGFQERGNVTVNLNASAADLYSMDNIRKFLIPALDEIDRRRGKK